MAAQRGKAPGLVAGERGAYLALGLGLLVANLKVLCALDGLQADGLAIGARQTQGDFLGSLRLLVADGLRLTAKPSLLAVVPPLALRHKRGLAGLVLRNLEDLVVAALGRLAEGLGRLRGVHHCELPAGVEAETQASGATGNERSATGVPRGQPADEGRSRTHASSSCASLRPAPRPAPDDDQPSSV